MNAAKIKSSSYNNEGNAKDKLKALNNYLNEKFTNNNQFEIKIDQIKLSKTRVAEIKRPAKEVVDGKQDLHTAIEKATKIKVGEYLTKHEFLILGKIAKIKKHLKKS
ncbi:MAG: hypothetical protein PHC75_07375 [Burkholderiales bacterium]|nr:hypothetical protein [Burkholderiales bacterium]